MLTSYMLQFCTTVEHKGSAPICSYHTHAHIMHAAISHSLEYKGQAPMHLPKQRNECQLGLLLVQNSIFFFTLPHFECFPGPHIERSGILRLPFPQMSIRGQHGSLLPTVPPISPLLELMALAEPKQPASLPFCRCPILPQVNEGFMLLTRARWSPDPLFFFSPIPELIRSLRLYNTLKRCPFLTNHLS
jgi:hypothetical protein